jgi:tetratricopeptide (TPR) repeat protein
MSDEGEWVLIELDPRLAKAQGMPVKLPVPKGEFESLADKGLTIKQARDWVQSFVTSSPMMQSSAWKSQNAEMASALESFLSKGAMWEKARKAFETQDYKKAISTLRLISNIDKNDHAARQNLANALANQNDFDGALKLMLEIYDTFKGNADFHVSLGQIYISKNQHQDAAEEMSLALEADPSCKAAMDVLVKLGVLISVYEDPTDASSLCYLRADSVLGGVVEFWESAPRDQAFYENQLSYHEMEGRFDVALAAAERAEALCAESGEAVSNRIHMGHVSALRQLGRQEDALEVSKKVIETNPEAAWAYVEQYLALMAQSKGDEAKAALDRALEIDPGEQSALFLRFWPEEMKDIAKVQACIPALIEHAKAHESSAGAWLSLARAKASVGSDDEAVEYFAKAAALAPENDDLIAEYWQELARQRKFEAIVAEAEKIEDMKKRDWRVRWNEAEAYAGLKKTMEARAAFTAINHDESLQVDIRKRAKRAVNSLQG